MQRKMAIVLAIMVLSYSVSVSADTDGKSNNTQEESATIFVEEEPQTEKPDSTISDDSAPSEKEDPEHEEDKQETSSVELLETTSAQEKPETSEKVPEEESTNKSIQQPEKNDSETLVEEETLPTSAENQPVRLLEDNKEILAEQRERRAISSEDDVIYNVSFPANTHAFLDPGNLSGNGQIFSEHYEIENFGDTDIAIKIKSIEIWYTVEEGSYEFSEEKITDSLPQVKKMNLDMVWEKDGGAEQKILHVTGDVSDEYVMELKAAGNGDGSVGYFYFTGTMNPNHSINWEEDDLSVAFHYEILNLANMEKETPEDGGGLKSDTESSVIRTEPAEIKNEETKNEEIDDAAESDKTEPKETEPKKEETEGPGIEEEGTQRAEEMQAIETEAEETAGDAAGKPGR